MISVRLQGKPFNITVIQVYAPTINAEEAEVERCYEDLQELLELTPKKDVLFIIGDWNAKVGSQETPGITGKLGLGMNRDHSVIFETASKYCILDSFVDHDGYSISSEGFLPTVVDIMVI